MNLSDKAVKEFKQIFKAERGIELSDGEAKFKAEKLLNLMKLITSPIKNERNKNN